MLQHLVCIQKVVHFDFSVIFSLVFNLDFNVNIDLFFHWHFSVDVWHDGHGGCVAGGAGGSGQS